MLYYSGRGNLACTIFVPFKCGNNCPFCNTNKFYDGYVYDDKYLDGILKWIDYVNKNNDISEFVLTGGEPFFNLGITKKIISRMWKKVFINTTLPKLKNIDEIIDYINSEKKIYGINISRHIGLNYSVGVCGKEIIDKIKKNVRINCLVKDDYTDKEIFDFIDYWATPHRMINFRADYRNITTDTLKNRDKWSEFFLTNFRYEKSSNCLVCNSEFYSDDVYKVICYHRGLEHSCVIYGNRCYVNDVLIDIYGNIYKDWDMIKDGEFEDWIKKGK